MINNIFELINLKNLFLKKNVLIKFLNIFLLLLFIIKDYKTNISFINYKNLIFKNKENKIKIGIVSQSLKNGGCEKQTSLIINYLYKFKIPY